MRGFGWRLAPSGGGPELLLGRAGLSAVPHSVGAGACGGMLGLVRKGSGGSLAGRNTRRVGATGEGGNVAGGLATGGMGLRLLLRSNGNGQPMRGRWDLPLQS